MYPVSNEFNQKVNAPQRSFTARVEVYLDGEEEAPMILSDAEIVSFTVLEDMNSTADSPLSFVGANELSLSIKNENGEFSPHNEESPHNGKLLPEVKVKAFLLLEISENTYEEVPMGVYWTGEWKAPYSGLTTTVTCYDLLYKLKQLPIPQLPIFFKKTIKDVTKTLFNALGLIENEDYVIEAALAQRVPLGWLDGNRVADAFVTITEAGACTIGIDKQGKIFIRSLYQFNESNVAFTGHEQVMTPETELNYLKAYNKAEVLYKVPSIRSTVTEVMSVSTLIVQPGLNEYTGFVFSSIPVAAVTNIAITNGRGIEIQSASTGTRYLNFTLWSNHSQEQEVRLTVHGHLFNRADTDVAYPTQPEDKILIVDNALIQSKQVALEYRAVLQNFLDTPKMYINTDLRGNPAVEVMDVVSYENPYDYLGQKDIIPTRMFYTYDGALTCSMQAITKESLTVHDWVFLSPGMYARVIRGG